MCVCWTVKKIRWCSPFKNRSTNPAVTNLGYTNYATCYCCLNPWIKPEQCFEMTTASREKRSCENFSDLKKTLTKLSLKMCRHRIDGMLKYSSDTREQGKFLKLFNFLSLKVIFSPKNMERKNTH